ncbi:hypothetical protein ND861_19340 [Leptospira sp. 2 VSF19]|uniref:Uncharacterized protein n=1 Tax=Leptospira soteropolitanensis TaxID=2950025 RepID=A0AAW5VMK2_9LEPT|nr:hypothetical protein [Leptospira soteropolitanensis]MCW7494823.1 hypothetical protein [Leptospira soteropolitanensis]MCW7502389.1 hypothetical protein [Leptospira soteropolitanensis]MCW7524648.1 hypothetical protein [Leptospira soteropolitanensis]MCW7528519.1 hypothetical protein [Leptospira soteropolitanensis]MCW7532379.1 hypothetical protein [Leptospira soteropolitanensis]
MEKEIYLLLGNATITIIISVAVIKYLANKLIEDQFVKSLEKYRHKINLDFDRIQKINQKEFEVLPELWYLLNRYKTTAIFFLTKKILTEDINNYVELDLELFLKSIPITESQKLYIRNSNNKKAAYLQIVQDAGDAALQRDYDLLKIFFSNNKIFFTNRISTLVSEIDKFYFETTIIYHTLLNDQIQREIFAKDFEKSSQKILNQIYPEIKSRLKFTEE